MNSSDRNLNNPTQVLELDLPNVVKQFKSPSITCIERKQYEAMGEHDNMIYIIHEYPHEIYWGDRLISEGINERHDINPEKYLILYDPLRSEYVIYVTHPIYGFIDNHSVDPMNGMTEIERYKDPQPAIDSLKRLTFRGQRDSLIDILYNMITSYISKYINLSECITGIIGELGFKNSPDFQQLLQITMIYGCGYPQYKYTLPKEFLSILHELKEKTNNKLYSLYDWIYDIFISYDCFKDKCYDLDSHEYIDIHDPINRIITAYLNIIMS